MGHTRVSQNAATDLELVVSSLNFTLFAFPSRGSSLVPCPLPWPRRQRSLARRRSPARSSPFSVLVERTKRRAGPCQGRAERARRSEAESLYWVRAGADNLGPRKRGLCPLPCSGRPRSISARKDSPSEHRGRRPKEPPSSASSRGGHRLSRLYRIDDASRCLFWWQPACIFVGSNTPGESARLGRTGAEPPSDLMDVEGRVLSGPERHNLAGVGGRLAPFFSE
jgi:hypothetical protein